MKKLNSKEFMYITFVLILPVIMAFKYLWLYSAGALLALILLFYFDPTFKAYKKQVTGGNKFLYLTVILGGGLAFISYIWGDFRGILITLWFLVTYIYGMKIASIIDKK